jgi:hypothetical protein
VNMKWKDDVYFQVMADQIKLDNILAKKEDSDLVQDLLLGAYELPSELETVLHGFATSGRNLSKEDRKKLEGFYRLLYSELLTDEYNDGKEIL